MKEYEEVNASHFERFSHNKTLSGDTGTKTTRPMSREEIKIKASSIMYYFFNLGKNMESILPSIILNTSLIE